IRAAAAKLLEGMRAAGTIGASLQAEVTLHADAATRARFAEVGDELRFFFITSQLRWADVATRPAHAEALKLDGSELWVAAQASQAAKCIRCWHYREDVGSHAEHPEICARCVDNVDGAGEVRQWF
ncbi:partial Isoleucine--tRNA ligase, partial [Gammaproteobacteria bacterium]